MTGLELAQVIGLNLGDKDFESDMAELADLFIIANNNLVAKFGRLDFLMNCHSAVTTNIQNNTQKCEQ